MEYSPEFYKRLVDELTEGVYFVDRDRRITYWNHGAESLSGYLADEVRGQRCSDNLLVHVDADGNQLCKDGCPLEATMLDGEDRSAEVFLHHKQGHRVPVRIRAHAIRDRDGEIVGAAEVFDDNSAALTAREQVETLKRMSLLDPLTGIGNRRYLETRIRSGLDQTQRYGWPLALIFLDVDDFKRVNDEHGHAVGDRVLSLVANTLKNGARSFDAVGRWGGEEFIVTLTNIEQAQALQTAERLRVLVESAWVSAGEHAIRVTVSLGATEARPDDSLESLVGRADELMYRSKRNGRNRVSTDIPAGEFGPQADSDPTHP